MPGPSLIYNGVLLRDCSVEDFRDDPVYDDSGTDIIYTRTTIRVSSLVYRYTDPTDSQEGHFATVITSETNDSATDENYSVYQAGTTQQQRDLIARRLGEKGKLLYFFYAKSDVAESGFVTWRPGESHPYVSCMGIGPDANAAEFVAVHSVQVPDPESGTSVESVEVSLDPSNPHSTRRSPIEDVVDCDNGPKPQHVQYSQAVGDKSLRLTFEIVVCRVMCNESPAGDPYPATEPDPDPDNPYYDDKSVHKPWVKPVNGIISNRWYELETRDQNWVTTRTIKGVLRVASKLTLPMLQRNLVMPPLLKGYQRIGMKFETDPTDLIMHYEVTDRQQHASPPYPAIDFEGEYDEICGVEGANQLATMKLRMIGPPGVDKRALLGAAGRMIFQRFEGIQKDPGNENQQFNGILQRSRITEDLKNPVIEMEVVYKFAESITGDKLRLRLSKIGMMERPTRQDSEGSNEVVAEPIENYDPQEWPSPIPYDSTSPVGIMACYLQNPCSRWHTPATYYEDFARPATDENGESRPRYVSPSDAGFDIDVRSVDGLTDKLEPDMTRYNYSQFQGFPYEFVSVRSIYRTDTGYKQMPLAQTQLGGDTCRLIRMHSGITTRTFQIEVSRIGKVPQIPTPREVITDPNGITETLLECSIRDDSPEIQADAVSASHRILAEYKYALSRPPTPEEKLRMAISPIDDLANDERVIEGADLFTDDLIEWQPPVT